jgi:hypothetical protein
MVTKNEKEKEKEKSRRKKKNGRKIVRERKRRL